MRVGSSSHLDLPILQAMEDPIRYLTSLPRFDLQGGLALKPGLDRIEALLERMGHPQRSYPSIHVGGTNGKGSTASFIAAIASATGRRVGLHTTPHLKKVGELMRVDGAPAGDEWIAQAVAEHRRTLDELRPSFFEATVALSLSYFAERNVDLAVVEVGLGGRLDATNVLHPIAAVITNVGLEHQQFLGDTLEAIATEKAGIIKEGIPVVTAVGRDVEHVLEAQARRRKAPIHHVDDEMHVVGKAVGLRASTVSVVSPVRAYTDLQVALAGRHQIRNALTAVRAAELALEDLREHAQPVFDGLRDVRARSGLHGRMEILHEDPLVVADVAHNADGLTAVLDHLSACGRSEGRLTVLLGLMRDKDVHALGRLLLPWRALVRPVPIPSQRALSVGELASALQVVGVSVAKPCEVREGVLAFLSDASHPDTLLITGSHLVVAQLESADP